MFFVIQSSVSRPRSSFGTDLWHADDLDTLAAHVGIDFLEADVKDLGFENAVGSDIVVSKLEQRVGGASAQEAAVGMNPVLELEKASLRANFVPECASAGVAFLLVERPVVEIVERILT